ncbi:MAG: transglutaminase-like cysteine peptidase [Sneathiella sp.]|uniref:transglutaminase-like cysteine peptidase n=1 Tax=Sneathiella sp. TaxID=1964365 RepID=UPI003003318D
MTGLLLKLRVSILALVLGGALLISPLATNAEAVGLFDYRATPYEGLKPFPKWRHVLESYKDEPGDCQSGKYNRCAHQKWLALIEDWRELSKEEQLNRVNRHMNLFRYILDPVNWGVRDYWETPKEFFARFGDCEDYAIVKYFTLRALGWSADDMKIVVLQDMNLGIAHAILVVEFNGENLVLDNQIGQVINANRIKHYRPIYSVNEIGWWRHKEP